MGHRRGTARLRVLLLAVLVLSGVLTGGLTGCSYSSQEPGLLGRGSDAPTDPAADRRSTPFPAPSRASSGGPSPGRGSADPATGPPVLGDAVWTSADGRAVTVRIAVHAVRRLPGGTVLDWSVTPLSAPGLSSAGLPAVDLGLTPAGRPAIALVDPTDDQVYRPLLRRDGGCVCSAVGPAVEGWRIGTTRLLQIAFPPLPAGLTRVDVGVGTVPVLGGVPVTAVGRVPRAEPGVDLARPIQLPAPYLAGPGFDYPGEGGQRLAVQPHQILAGPTATSLVWRVQALTAGAGLERAATPPLATSNPRITGNRAAASGPVLRVGERRFGSRLATDRASGPDSVTCLCTDLRVGTQGLRSRDQVATLVTTYDPLPPGTREVLVEFPGYGERRLDVTLVPGPRPQPTIPDADPQYWTSVTGAAPSWDLDAWPTPLPDPRLLADTEAVVDELVR